MQESKKTTDRFSTVLYALPERISAVLESLPVFIKSSACEIRLRLGGAVCITGERNFYISEDSVASSNLPRNPLIVTKNDLNEVLLRITNRSVYTREEELRAGYLSMRSGNRAGVCGRFSGGKLQEATSVNIRIAREIKGCAQRLVDAADRGLLIAGPPGSGKTTLLRDLVRLLSNGGDRVCVIDTRGEICGRTGEGYFLDVGPNTDIISGLEKAAGAEIALRTMFPQYIAFDEVGTGRELSLIRESFFSGVKILTTAHASSVADIASREVTKMLLDGSIGSIAMLSKRAGGEISFITPDEVKRLA